MKSIYAIGLMSGTSMDGVDVALIKTNGKELTKSQAASFLPYPHVFQHLLKAVEYAIQQSKGNLKQAEEKFDTSLKEYFRKKLQLNDIETQRLTNECQLYMKAFNYVGSYFNSIEIHLTYLHFLAVKKLLLQNNLSFNDISVIGFHGQTLMHRPSEGISIQWGKAEQLSKYCNVPVVSKFRQNDIKNGGQGAPFAPLYHQALAKRDKVAPCIIVNCGGIANLTYVGLEQHQLMAYDAGPGNCLLDQFVQKRSKGLKMFDINGQLASEGNVHHELIQLLKQKSCNKNNKNFHEQRPPKSLDVNDIVLPKAFDHISIEDGCATLATFTAQCIVESLALTDLQLPQYWVLAGGGFKNPFIINALKKAFQEKYQMHLLAKLADEIGWHADALEAEIFAFLAVRSLRQLPLSLPSTTGVKEPVTGGEIF